MTVLEVVRLRSTQYPLEDLNRMIKDSILSDFESTDRISIFRSSGLMSDIVVHLHREVEQTPVGKSTIGNHLATALRAFGIVEHSLWEEMK